MQYACLSSIIILCLYNCSQVQPEFNTSTCAFNEENLSVLIQVNLADSTFYYYENHLWRPINDHEGQDTHCTLVDKQMTLKSCWLLYCTDQVRICNNRICQTTEASTLPYCEQYSQITFQIEDHWQQFTVIIPIQ
ncbi:MAG: hypothetical protein AAF599_02735 [Bacteroidota bacterium]